MHAQGFPTSFPYLPDAPPFPGLTGNGASLRSPSPDDPRSPGEGAAGQPSGGGAGGSIKEEAHQRLTQRRREEEAQLLPQGREAEGSEGQSSLQPALASWSSRATLQSVCVLGRKVLKDVHILVVNGVAPGKSFLLWKPKRACL